jgi:WhiB family redox-sensing transcriptional regulator
MSGVLRLASTPDWRDGAACLGMDQAIFFPELGANPNAAKRICGTCTERAACLEFALSVEARGLSQGRPHGVYGGLSPTERLPLLRELWARAA